MRAGSPLCGPGAVPYREVVALRISTSSRVYIGRLAGTTVFDPIGDPLGRVHDAVVIMRHPRPPRMVGLVVEVTGRRRVFLPITRVTSITAGAVISTGLLNIRRFEQRASETLVLGQVLDRRVTLRDGSGEATVEDVGIDRQRNGDWEVTTLFVRRARGRSLRRGEALTVDVDEVRGLEGTPAQQSAQSLLARYEELRPADLADVLRDLPENRRVEVAAELEDSRLADVLEELGDDDRIAIVSRLEVERAADVLEAMQPDDAADLVSDLPVPVAARLLGRMEPEDAEDVRRLMAYADNTAGGLMTTDPIVLAPETTVATFLAHARREDTPVALAAAAFIVRPPLETPTGRLLGVVYLQRALREPPHSALGTILDQEIETVGPHDGIGTVTRLMATYNHTALPVVDEERRLLGAVSVDDVLDHLLPDDWRDADGRVTDEAMERDTVERNAHG